MPSYVRAGIRKCARIRALSRLLATYIHVTANESSDTFIVTAAGGLIA